MTVVNLSDCIALRYVTLVHKLRSLTVYFHV